MCGQAVCLVAAGYCTCATRQLAVALIVISQVFVALQYSGFVSNPGDLAPHFAGTLYGLSNTFSTLSGIAAPLVASALTARVSGRARMYAHTYTQNTLDEWRSVYWISAAILVFGALIFAVFASGQVQPWAVHKDACELDMLDVDLIETAPPSTRRSMSPNSPITKRLCNDVAPIDDSERAARFSADSMTTDHRERF
jgi:hypothetical protein